MSLRSQKELELKIHDAFYKNMCLLTLVYPIQNNFKSVFKKNMFFKTNISGFQQVIYFLLEILDSERLKQRVPIWPPYDKRTETQFRNEVVNLINELNSFYENWDLPHLVASQVISPGGFKFIKFMLKLSKLVLVEHFKRHPEIASNFLLPIKTSKQQNITVNCIKRFAVINNNISRETNKLLKDFDSTLENAKIEAQKLVQLQIALNDEYKRNGSNLRLLKLCLHEISPEEREIESEVKENLERLKGIKDIIVKLETLSLNNCTTLEHNNELIIPQKISNILSLKNNTLDLLNLMESSIMLNDGRRMEVQPFHENQRLDQIRKLTDFNRNITSMLEELELSIKTSKTLIKDIQIGEDSDLAVPLF